MERTLLFNLRSAFVSTLQSEAVLKLANDNLAYYDHVLEISRDFRCRRHCANRS